MSRKKTHIPKKREYGTRVTYGNSDGRYVYPVAEQRVEMYSTHSRYNTLCQQRIIGSRVMRMDQQATCKGCLQRDHKRGWKEFREAMVQSSIKVQWEALSPEEQEQARALVHMLRSQAEGAQAEFARQVQRQLLLGDV